MSAERWSLLIVVVLGLGSVYLRLGAWVWAAAKAPSTSEAVRRRRAWERGIVVVLLTIGVVACVVVDPLGDVATKGMPGAIGLLFLFSVAASIWQRRVVVRGLTAEASSDPGLYWWIIGVFVVSGILMIVWSVAMLAGR